MDVGREVAKRRENTPIEGGLMREEGRSVSAEQGREREQEGRRTLRERCPPRHIPVAAIRPVQLASEDNTSTASVQSSSYASSFFSA